MSKQVVFERRGSMEGADQRETICSPAHSRPFLDSQARFRCVPIWTAMTVFNLLPNLTSAAAGKDDMFVTIGTGTEIPARAAKGGVNLKTQVTTPADNDNILLQAVAGSAMIVPITAISQPRFACRVALSQVTELVASAGMDENNTSPLPDGTAGEGAAFLFDPAQEITTGLTAAQHANWILTEKVNGVDTFVATTVPVLASVDYELEIQVGADLKPTYFINGVQAGVGASALTSGDSFGALVGLQINAAAPAGQKDMDVRYVAVERRIG